MYRHFTAAGASNRWTAPHGGKNLMNKIQRTTSYNSPIGIFLTTNSQNIIYRTKKRETSYQNVRQIVFCWRQRRRRRQRRRLLPTVFHANKRRRKEKENTAPSYSIHRFNRISKILTLPHQLNATHWFIKI